MFKSNSVRNTECILALQSWHHKGSLGTCRVECFVVCKMSNSVAEEPAASTVMHCACDLIVQHWKPQISFQQ